jgi:hypothetical protein
MMEERPTSKNLGAWSIFFNLYDLFGYFTPGFIFIIGLYYLYHDDINKEYSLIINDYDISIWGWLIGVFVLCYILGHLFSAISKIPEIIITRLDLGIGILYYLFYGIPTNKNIYARGISYELKKRYFSNYYSIFIEKHFKEPMVPEQFIRIIYYKIRMKYLKVTDLIWDSCNYLLQHCPSEYGKAYDFLSLSGMFRTLSVVWFLLTLLFVHKYYSFPLYISMILVLVLIISRYLKFERMYYYQIIRAMSMSNVLIPNEAITSKSVWDKVQGEKDINF